MIQQGKILREGMGGGVSTALEEGSRSKDTPSMVSGSKRERMGTNTSRLAIQMRMFLFDDFYFLKEIGELVMVK